MGSTAAFSNPELWLKNEDKSLGNTADSSSDHSQCLGIFLQFFKKNKIKVPILCVDLECEYCACIMSYGHQNDAPHKKGNAMQ